MVKRPEMAKDEVNSEHDARLEHAFSFPLPFWEAAKSRTKIQSLRGIWMTQNTKPKGQLMVSNRK
jgi:hypothetical protein